MRYYGMNREYVIVPAHCMLVKRSVFVQLGGFSDKFRTELSALDFCLRVREHGYRIVNAAHAKKKSLTGKCSFPVRDAYRVVPPIFAMSAFYL